MEGLTGSELAMIKKLAGNDTLVRKKSMKILKKWLTAISMKVPDSPDCRELIENNFLRVWKALFYCMWHADKPLPQEQLAEQISSLVVVFAAKPNVMNLFIEWFFRTMAREWSYIDRFRLDKFQMLIRRFIRSTLMVLSERKWKLDVLDGFLRVITVILFNHHPEIKNTRSKARDPDIEKSPLGLQIHIVDVFLEELAKVGETTLKSQKILKILNPFIQELCTNDDDRILKELKDRIFFHLMRQSDAGIDYAEGCLGINDEVEDGEEIGDEEEGDEELGGAEDEELLISSAPLDPRAGGVDAMLPQLDVDYNELSSKLIEAGGQKTVKSKNRKIVYSLARKFKEITVGDYPLAIEVDDDRTPAIQHRDLKAATERLLKLEEKFSNPDRKKRPPKKVRKRLAKQKEQAEAEAISLNDSVGSESDNQNSIYLEDDELLDHVSDNYMSYLEELHHKEGKENENGLLSDEDDVGFSDDEGDADLINGEEVEPQELKEAVVTKAKLKKNNKKAKVEVAGQNSKQLEMVPSSSVNNTPKTTPKNDKKTKKSAAVVQLNRGASTSEDNSESMASILNNNNEENSLGNNSFSDVSSAKKQQRKKLTVAPLVKDVAATQEGVNGDMFITLSATPDKKKPKKRKMSELMSLGLDSGTSLKGMSPLGMKETLSAKRKRVSFVLARNSQHEHSDYAHSINRSPAIPFEPEKQPGLGLLKSPKSFAGTSGTPTRVSSLIKNGLSTPRRKSGLF